MHVRSSAQVDGAWLHLKHDSVCGLVFWTLLFPSRATPMAMEADVFLFGHPDLTLIFRIFRISSFHLLTTLLPVPILFGRCIGSPN